MTEMVESDWANIEFFLHHLDPEMSSLEDHKKEAVRSM